MNEYDTEPSRPHAEWFMQLPVAVRHWLENLRQEDIKEIQDSIKLKRRVEAGGWLFKWISITVVSFFVGSVALGESIGKWLTWFTHAGKP